MAVNKKVEDLRTDVASITKLEGPQGATGATGKVGPKGDQGKQGIVGERGTQGVSGAQGKTGKTGKAAYMISDVQLDLDNRLTITMSDGSVIDAGAISGLAENGSTIYSSGGMRRDSVIKLIEENMNMTYNTLIDTVDTFKYVGESLPGSATSARLWRIKRIDQTDTGGDVNILWANGVATLDQIWDDRLTLTYTATGA